MKIHHHAQCCNQGWEKTWVLLKKKTKNQVFSAKSEKTNTFCGFLGFYCFFDGFYAYLSLLFNVMKALFPKYCLKITNTACIS